MAMRSNDSGVPRSRWLIGLAGVFLAIAFALVLAYSLAMSRPALTTLPPGSPVVSLAAMGDSNTHSYQDSLTFSGERNQRGGKYLPRTFQWGEVIARLRPQEIDPGPWRAWGVSNLLLDVLDVAGLPVGRAPRKEDYLYNFANDSAQCWELMQTRRRQAPRLVALMDKSPERWINGVVVIRTGVEISEVLDFAAQDPAAPQVRTVTDECIGYIAQAVKLIRDAHPTVRIVLVGPFNDSNDAAYIGRWQSAAEIANIDQAYRTFDAALQRIVQTTPHTSFFDDRAWFASHWGGRGPNGEPAYNTVAIGKNLRVSHSLGNGPANSMLEDDHNGLVWNVLWAQAMTQHLHDVAKLPVTPITDEEVTRFVESLVAAPP